MAQRRMFSLQIVDTDAFLEMPTTTQNLYFHLGMRADDDGFVSNPKKIMKITGCGEDDIKILLTKRFIIGFDSGVIVIKHWRMHNYIRADRYNETTYLSEKSKLKIKDNGSYTETKELSTVCQPDVNRMDTQVRLGKVRLGKVSIYNEHIFIRMWDLYDKKTNKQDAIKEFKRIDEKYYDVILNHIPKYVEANEKRYRADFCRYLKRQYWENEIIKPARKQSFREQNSAINDINEMTDEEANFYLKINQKQLEG